MLTIKLRRVGKKKQPVFRLVVTEKGRDPWGDNLEIVGWMNPRTKEKSLEVQTHQALAEQRRSNHGTIHNLLVAEKIIEGDKRRSITISKVRQGKIDAKKPKPAEPKIEEAPKAEETTPAA